MTGADPALFAEAEGVERFEVAGGWCGGWGEKRGGGQ